jgi:hypothetical protein
VDWSGYRLDGTPFEVPNVKPRLIRNQFKRKRLWGSENKGLIEFDFDSFKIDSDSKIVKIKLFNS